MKTNKDFIEDYNKAFIAMRDKAVEVIKAFGRELDLMEIGIATVCQHDDLESEPELDDALHEWCDAQLYNCGYKDDDGRYHLCTIIGVRWNEEHRRVEAHLSSCSDDSVDEWMPVAHIDNFSENVYRSVLEFIREQPEEQQPKPERKDYYESVKQLHCQVVDDIAAMMKAYGKDTVDLLGSQAPHAFVVGVPDFDCDLDYMEAEVSRVYLRGHEVELDVIWTIDTEEYLAQNPNDNGDIGDLYQVIGAKDFSKLVPCAGIDTVYQAVWEYLTYGYKGDADTDE